MEKESSVSISEAKTVAQSVFSESGGDGKSRNPKSNLKHKKSKKNKVAPDDGIPAQKSVKIAANPKTGKPGSKKTIKKKKKVE